MKVVPRLLSSSIAFAILALVTLHGQAPRTFRVWVFSDAHVGSDKKNGRDSLATALQQSEAAAGFDWNIALDLGDMSGAQGPPKDPEGEEIVRQFSVLKRHHREDIYDLSGNHGRNGLDEPQAWWWRKWIDPTGEHAEFSHVDAKKRPFPIEGTWERYSFRAGNLLFLMMSDINEPTQKVGRGTLGGNPGGVVSGETFRWWKQKVEQNRSSIVISAHHYVLKNTTVASGEWEGMQRDDNGAGNPGTTVTILKVRREVRHSCTGWTANRIPAHSRMSWRPRPGASIYGSAPTRTPTRMTPTAGNRTSSGVGVRRSSTSLT